VEVDTFAKIRASVASREQNLRKTVFSVLVWAPGDDFFTKKRADIIKQLKKEGFEAFTSEQLGKKFTSSTPLPYQELSHWEAVNLVIVLEAGVAPAMELASFVFFPGFCEKCVVFHPRDYVAVGKTTYTAELLRLFPNRVIYSDKEMQDCTIIDECLHRAKAFRHCAALKHAPR
jgi:hypothetical protein